MAFGIVRDDGCLYRGVVRRDGLLPGLPPKLTKSTQRLVEAGQDLPATITAWRQVLENLMTGFQAGDARIDPKSGLKTCASTYCELQSLCRVGELERQRQAGRQDRQQEPPA